jgi:hypothetical protein
MRATLVTHLIATNLVLAALCMVGCGGSVSDQGGSAAARTGAGGADDGAGGATSTATGRGGASATTTTGAGGPEVYPAPHPAPHTVQSYGGPIMSSPKVLPIFFGDDDPTTTNQIEAFLAALQSSTYFGSAAAEYGVGAATILPAVHLTEDAPTSTSDSDIQGWLADEIEAGDGVFPQPDAETIYLLYYPSGTQIDLNGFGTSCEQFGGYHADTRLSDGTAASYAVIPRCPASQGLTAMQAITDATSHELLEAATDPRPFSDPAYDRIDDAHVYVELVLLTEIGDQCAFSPSGYATYPDLPYEVQRVYSNASALAGHNPCVPIPSGEVYFVAAPDPQDDVQITGPDGAPVTMKGTQIAEGESANVDVAFFSDAPHDAWYVAAYDAASLTGAPANLEFAFSGGTTGQNGDHLTMSVKVLSRGQYGLEPYLLYSVSSTGEMNVWPGFVYTP